MPMKKTKKIICFEMLKDVKILKTNVLVFSRKKQGSKYVKKYLAYTQCLFMYWVQMG